MGIEISNGFSLTAKAPVVASDLIAAQLAGAQLTAYNAASVGAWVKVTQAQYNAVVANVTGATKKGNSDSDVNKRDTATGYPAPYWNSFGASGTPSFQINSGEYVIAMITEAWNQSGGNSQLAYTTTFNGNSITNIGGLASPTTGGGRDYFVRKAPTDAASETRYPLLKMSVSPNGVSGWNGYHSNDNGSTWASNPATATPKIQIVTTSTKSW